jgi:hypothetical protein
MTAWQTVHVRVNDAATGRPTPVLIRFEGPDGAYYPPFGRLAEFATGRGEDVGGNCRVDGRSFAYIDGACEVRLPVGPVNVWAFKGSEYQPLGQTLVVSPGKMAFRLTIERRRNPRQEGWYPGDTQVYFLPPHAALLEAAAEDLAVVNLLACAVEGNSHPPALPNLLAFSGQRPALESADPLIVVNTRNEHSVLGRLALLNCHRPVYPLLFGGPKGHDDWTLADWCDQCHRKGGLVVAADFFSQRRWERGEVIADLILGKIDALDVAQYWLARSEQAVEFFWPWYYLLLNCGLRVPLVGGSSKDSNTTRLGAVRTYARLAPGEGLTYRNWIEAVRAGRTFVSDSSALLLFTVNGRGPGSILRLPPSAEKVQVRVEAQGLVRFPHLQVIGNGQVVAEGGQPGGSPGPPTDTAVLEAEVPVGEGGWLAARLGYLPGAHTSPVYLESEGRPQQPDPVALRFLRNHLDAMLEWVAREGRFENDQQRQRLAGVFQSAKQTLAGRKGGL